MSCPTCSGLRLLTITAAARLMGLSRWTLHTLLKDGKLKAIPVNGWRKIAASEIIRWQRENGVAGNEELKQALDGRRRYDRANYIRH